MFAIRATFADQWNLWFRTFNNRLQDLSRATWTSRWTTFAGGRRDRKRLNGRRQSRSKSDNTAPRRCPPNRSPAVPERDRGNAAPLRGGRDFACPGLAGTEHARGHRRIQADLRGAGHPRFVTSTPGVPEEPGTGYSARPGHGDGRGVAGIRTSNTQEFAERRTGDCRALRRVIPGALNFFGTAPFYPDIARDLDTTVPLVGQVTTLMILISTVLGLAVGPIADRYGYRLMLVIGVVAVAVNLVGIGSRRPTT